MKCESLDAGMVDLGLSVKWANCNVGANSSLDYGGLYGWGDSTGGNLSLNNNEYPNCNPPMCISATNYDIAHVN